MTDETRYSHRVRQDCHCEACRDAKALAAYAVSVERERDALAAEIAALREWQANIRKVAAQHVPVAAPSRNPVSPQVSVTYGTHDPRVEKASALCRELVEGTDNNVPIQSVYEAMLKLIGRDDVIAAMEADYQRLATPRVDE